MQIIFVGHCHWCIVSNIGCDGVVNVYDSMYISVYSGMIKSIANMFGPAEQLIGRMMDVGGQLNGSDYGVLAMRRHLADCLENCGLSRFPVISKCRTVGIRHTQSVDLQCYCCLPEAKWLSVTYVKLGITSIA